LAQQVKREIADKHPRYKSQASNCTKKDHKIKPPNSTSAKPTKYLNYTTADKALSPYFSPVTNLFFPHHISAI